MTEHLPFPFSRNRSALRLESKDVAFAKYLVQEIGVACVPGSSFYNDAQDGASQVRFKPSAKKKKRLAPPKSGFSKIARVLTASLRPQIFTNFAKFPVRNITY